MTDSFLTKWERVLKEAPIGTAQRQLAELMLGPTEECKAAIWRERANDLATQVDKLNAERLKLDKRIHNQRVALRQNWEIVEMRQNYMGSRASRKAFADLLRRHKALLAQVRDAGQS